MIYLISLNFIFQKKSVIIRIEVSNLKFWFIYYIYNYKSSKIVYFYTFSLIIIEKWKSYVFEFLKIERKMWKKRKAFKKRTIFQIKREEKKNKEIHIYGNELFSYIIYIIIGKLE